VIITRDEVKSYLGIHDKYVENETVTLDSVVYQKLDHKNNVSIIYVAKDSDNSSVHTSYFTTADYYTTIDYGGNFLIRKIDTSTISDTETIYVRYIYNDYDTRINDLIPMIQADIVEYLNNYFPDSNTRYESVNIRLLSSGPYIYDTAEGRFEIEGFAAGMDIALEGTYRNRGIYTISTMTSAVMTLSSNDTILSERSSDECGGNSLVITRVKWPIGLKRTIAKIIWLNIDKEKGNNIKSKSLGPSAITYQDLESGGYPQDIYRELEKYRNAFVR